MRVAGSGVEQAVVGAGNAVSAVGGTGALCASVDGSVTDLGDFHRSIATGRRAVIIAVGVAACGAASVAIGAFGDRGEMTLCSAGSGVEQAVVSAGNGIRAVGGTGSLFASLDGRVADFGDLHHRIVTGGGAVVVAVGIAARRAASIAICASTDRRERADGSACAAMQL